MLKHHVKLKAGCVHLWLKRVQTQGEHDKPHRYSLNLGIKATTLLLLRGHRAKQRTIVLAKCCVALVLSLK